MKTASALKKLLILVEYDEAEEGNTVDAIHAGILGAFADLDHFARVDIEGVDGVTREGILADIMHVGASIPARGRVLDVPCPDCHAAAAYGCDLQHLTLTPDRFVLTTEGYYHVARWFRSRED